MKLAVFLQRAIMRYIATSELSNRRIADLYDVSPTTVSRLRLKFAQSDQTWESLASLSDNDFESQLGTLPVRKSTVLQHPDYAQIHQEIQTKDMTLKLLHLEYLNQMHETPDQAIRYSTFTEGYGRWLKKQRISMRQVHKAGEKMFVDFCGKTMPITNPKTGEISYAQIFIAVLGASAYTFVCAVPSQKQNDWISCHIKAFEYFQGVPKQIVPDNLKAAVIKHKLDSILLNKGYADMAEHYQCVISPARPRKPKDKGLAEVTVQIVQRWILAALRMRKFFSVEELNEEILKRLEELNTKFTNRYPTSRKNLFETLDKPALIPLPNIAYLFSQWKYGVRVPNDYHVDYKEHFYSVPYQYIDQIVDLRANNNVLEIFMHNYRIAAHILKNENGTSTLQEHQPVQHRVQSENEPDALIEWAKHLRFNTREWVLRNLQYRRDFATGLKAVRRLKTQLREEQNHEVIELACKFALEYDILGFQRLLDIVKHKSYHRKPLSNQSSNTTLHSNIRGANYYKQEV